MLVCIIVFMHICCGTPPCCLCITCDVCLLSVQSECECRGLMGFSLSSFASRFSSLALYLCFLCRRLSTHKFILCSLEKAQKIKKKKKRELDSFLSFGMKPIITLPGCSEKKKTHTTNKLESITFTKWLGCRTCFSLLGFINLNISCPTFFHLERKSFWLSHYFIHIIHHPFFFKSLFPSRRIAY